MSRRGLGLLGALAGAVICSTIGCDGCGTTITTFGGGGAGGGPECEEPKDCAGKDTECRVRACADGACGFADADEGTECTDDQGQVCDGKGKCVLPPCQNGKLDGQETDIDCGGPSCPSCGVGKTCGKGSDCASGVCTAGTCSGCLGGVVAVAAGGDYTCAVKADGTLWCWGWNQYGQLGDGTTQDKPLPTQVSALGTSAVAVAAGADHTCAVKADSALWCCGWNQYGQLGDGTTQDKPLPTQVKALGTSAVAVAAGWLHTCAVKADGTLWCWGHNEYGQLGDGTTQDKPLPTQVSALGTSAIAVAAGRAHTCAIKKDGALWCWGRNDYGQLGNGTTQSKSSPVQVSALGGCE
ncbi:MAG: hypothetical protein HY744_25195 [Deltaproteobacteria bacterium]|nr:hypothetical protein [Deltaproteobacteria bacterium]